MKIIIATPLYPPEIAEPAPYVKTLAKILKNKKIDVSIITYSLIPEKIKGVKIFFINKHFPLFIRLFLFTFKLLIISKKADIIYSLNGASVELPVFLVSKLTQKQYIIQTGDEKATLFADKNKFFNYIRKKAFKRAIKIIKETPLPRPEITLFDKNIENEMIKYEKSWENHIQNLIKIFKNV